MCCADTPGRPNETVGSCKECDRAVDVDGISTEESCMYSPEICQVCHDNPCDGSC